MASDQDVPNTLTYSISGGADSGKFTIDSKSGKLDFATAPDFDVPGDADGKNDYEVVVQASDGALTDAQTITVTVTNENESPTITSNGAGTLAAISLAENIAAVTIVEQTDPDAGTTFTYSLAGDDASLFTISGGGALAFKSAPSFETKGDSNNDNVYSVTVSVSDGALSDSQTINVTVTDVNEAPSISTTSLTGVENTTAFGTVDATDQDVPANKLTYLVTGGVDGSFFNIDSATGALSFKSAPNFEAAADSGANNKYEVEVTVADNVGGVTAKR